VRVAALYDIHGNLPALEAALAAVDEAGADLIVAGGDVALGPMPCETLERLLARGERVRFIRGNADRELVSAFGQPPGPDDVWDARCRWAAEQITGVHRTLLARLPATVSLDVGGLGTVLFCHGSPRSDEEIVTRLTPAARLRRILAGVEEPVVVCGHTHVQFDRDFEGTRLVNAGSVGMPYEGAPGAYWALLGPDVRLQRTGYDVESAAARIRTTGFPEADEFAVSYVLRPKSAAEASAHFEQVAGRAEAT